MDEMTLELAPQSSQQPARSPDQKQHSTFPLSRSVILSLAVFVLSFAVLLAGPALALRLMMEAVSSAPF
jgi:hypothetical protein